MTQQKGNLANLKMFPKGVSGNPSGMKRACKEVRDICKKMSPEACEKLGEIMRNGNADASIAAIKIILTRGIGKELEYSQLWPTKAKESGTIDVAGLSDDKLNRMLAIAREGES